MKLSRNGGLVFVSIGSFGGSVYIKKGPWSFADFALMYSVGVFVGVILMEVLA
jgi:hypothetical protein